MTQFNSHNARYRHTNGRPLTMSSHEIADLVERPHFHVLCDIRIMLAGLNLSENWYAQNWGDPHSGQQHF